MKLAALKEFGIGGAVRAWTQITAFAIIVVAGRVLSQEEFGVYAIAAVFTTLISTVLYSGVYEYIIKSDDTSAVADTCFWLNCAVAAVGFAVMIVAAPVMAHAVGAPELQHIMWLLAPSAFIPALTSWQEGLVLRQGKIDVYYYVWLFAETVSAGVTVFLFSRGFKIEALVAYRYCLGLVTAAGYLIHSARLPRLNVHADAVKAVWSFASRLFGSRLIGIAGNYGADLILGILAGSAQAGSYRLANRLVFGVGEVWFQPVKTIAWVKFSAAGRNRASFGREWVGLMTILSFVAWPALAGVACLSGRLTDVLLGDAWVAAAPVITILALAKSFELFESFLDPLLTLSDRARWLLRLRLGAACCAIAGFVAVAKFGAGPAAWVQVCIYLALGGMTLGLGVSITGMPAITVVAMLLPGLVATIATASAAAAADHVADQMQLSAVVRLAADVAGGVLAWSLVVGLIYRRRALAAIVSLQQPTEPDLLR